MDKKKGNCPTGMKASTQTGSGSDSIFCEPDPTAKIVIPPPPPQPKLTDEQKNPEPPKAPDMKLPDAKAKPDETNRKSSDAAKPSDDKTKAPAAAITIPGATPQ